MRKTVVLNIVGLTPTLLGPNMPRLTAWAKQGGVSTISNVFPAVTCSAQATYLTGKWPQEHGIIANGWYFRDECEIKFWRQSNKLIQAPMIWETARKLDPSFTWANLFWWFNMYSSADYSVTPRPMYAADGRKIPDIYTHPPQLREELQAHLGQFPLFNFWGPTASIVSSQWIAQAAKYVEEKFHPTLSLVYLPHLDYPLQRLGPNSDNIREDLQQIDTLYGDLIDFYERSGTAVIVLSEYGITPVTRAVHINRVLRENDLLTVRREMQRELIDAGASAAFAVSDHQIANVYVNDPKQKMRVRDLLSQTPGIERVLDTEGKRAMHVDHERAGDFIAVAEPDAWFSYYYWLDERHAPDFARTVDIHRKPGYDPVELFLDPDMTFPKFRVALRLLQKSLGFRALMDVIPLNTSLVKGSHGRLTESVADSPVLISRQQALLPRSISAEHVSKFILESITGE
ncbi:MAG TPA: nucleotide pyrophosphatase/phosphodiesterase family protein [Candidatus Angelobacter sp.]|nr:nucleotide pyrophosphatase/phosphodiesterase family protein [Candidatus Angelobacter sp.]